MLGITAAGVVAAATGTCCAGADDWRAYHVPPAATTKRPAAIAPINTPLFLLLEALCGRIGVVSSKNGWASDASAEPGLLRLRYRWSRNILHFKLDNLVRVRCCFFLRDPFVLRLRGRVAR